MICEGDEGPAIGAVQQALAAGSRFGGLALTFLSCSPRRNKQGDNFPPSSLHPISFRLTSVTTSSFSTARDESKMPTTTPSVLFLLLAGLAIATGHVVAVTGDGTNYAFALK
ncbi:hypothetical protein MLD38_011680 [Melastoma candidum]|uniref:Uncharacterized protein n=1 Tax=Melastoma candidum TaxID=119954 RepID=A0ACB9R6V4_9MYRT|nr:hypothetical protein MLD38_011680 [Melastoma candidum]